MKRTTLMVALLLCLAPALARTVGAAGREDQAARSGDGDQAARSGDGDQTAKSGQHGDQADKGDKGDKSEKKEPLSDATFAGLKLRGIGPAFISGRVADLAVDPRRPSTYYLGVASGGVWKTTNAGTTFEPIFDGEGSYSIGCVTIDPNDSLVVWVGTGENNSQRSVSYGDGVY
ncbi:MAG TPA: hypothetical protein VKY89_23150, partial [Thermoanaerobaculia bacterium]|nr:hypothetical protein [Thermoanaerobaculia bacterium]